MVPPGSRIVYGLTVSYSMCAATDVGVQAVSGSSGSMVKPLRSLRANTPPERGPVVHWTTHSMILAACQQGLSCIPRISGHAAVTDDERYAGAARGRKGQPEVAPYRALGCLGHAGTEVVGTRVGRASIDGDDIGAEGEAAGDGLGAEAGTEHAARHQDAHAVWR